jgi:K+-transporting ATPase ATPase C chain
MIKISVMMLLSFVIITGLLYPLMITVAAQVIFPRQANGTPIFKDGKLVGSELIGHQFDQTEYFWGRLSATAGFPYNAMASGGSNLSVLNPVLEKRISNRIAALRAADPENPLPIPVDLITASGSGLDPHISVASAEYQAARVARERNLPIEEVDQLIAKHTHGRIFGILGENIVNVLELNLALDGIQ